MALPRRSRLAYLGDLVKWRWTIPGVGCVLQQPARFDVDAFLHQPTPGSVRDVLLEAPGVRRFTLTAAQSTVVEGYLAKFGASAAGAGRLLTKVRLRDLLRHRELIPAPTLPVRPPSSTGNLH